MIRVLSALSIVALCALQPAAAQQSGQGAVWVQIEAHPSLRAAQERAQYFSDNLADVHGFALGGGWYGIVLGPYAPEDARRVLQVYRSEREIPRDSFIVQPNSLRQPFWPAGAVIPNTALSTDGLLGNQPETQARAAADPEPSDETPSEARRSEQLLTGQERRDLQVALQAAGFYNAAIDGAFGRGTRGAMAEWQSARGFEATGVLTTRQRKALMDEYNAPLISVGMRRHFDRDAGIEMQMPMDAVAFSRYEPPFAHYDSATDLGARVLLISQPGNRATLFGLYDIMQTLEIVPLDGPREKQGDSFTLVGRGSGIVSHTEARLQNGEIKGFTLIWPEGDEERRARVLTAMQQSFTRTGGVLSPAAGGNAVQSVDLVSGLQVRKPRLSRSGFFVDGKGSVVTVAEAVRNCTRVTLDRAHEADVVTVDDTLGVAVLRPTVPLAPMEVARLTQGEARLQSEITLSGFSYEGILGAPSLTYGTLADIKGLGGEEQLSRLALAAQEGDAGGPVFDAGGSVMGMLLPTPNEGRKLPDTVSFAADAQALRQVLQEAGLRAIDDTGASSLTPDELNRRATGMTVLVSCWD
ncbi:trypsin-like peptidase domain-containing protein [Lutimaribacter marinistellae]|uniref:Trypsin-like peptidase domain-containing protein n=1 Tax=Lutimaribacter marinistellae TaxID=1820329 RepID=A0ABV7TK06_9RHOB